MGNCVSDFGMFMLDLPVHLMLDLLCYIRQDAVNASVEWVFANQVKLAGQETLVQKITEHWKITSSLLAM